MSNERAKRPGLPKDKLTSVDPKWGKDRVDHFGYASDEERREKRGLEDWELVNKIPESQGKVPMWFVAVIVVVLLVAIGLSFPFWGNRAGYERAWFDWGFFAAIVYVTVGAIFVYYMVRMFGSGRPDPEPDETDPSQPNPPSSTVLTDEKKSV